MNTFSGSDGKSIVYIIYGVRFYEHTYILITFVLTEVQRSSIKKKDEEISLGKYKRNDTFLIKIIQDRKTFRKSQ